MNVIVEIKKFNFREYREAGSLKSEINVYIIYQNVEYATERKITTANLKECSRFKTGFVDSIYNIVITVNYFY